MEVKVVGGELTKEEIALYIEKLRQDNPDKVIKTVTLTVDGQEVKAEFTYESKPFERIRRITGYLVGTLDRFNNAKRAEVEDRVKHSLSSDSPEKI